MRYQFLLLSILGSFTSFAQIDPAQKIYYGLLHAHTLISDGSGTPVEAFAMAKARGLNFFAVTEHNHDAAESGAKERMDGVQIATTPALYNGASNVTITRNWKENDEEHTETITIKPLIRAARDATTASFVGLYGQEFSTISSSNHVNVFGVGEVLDMDNGDFTALVAKLKSLPDVCLVQLNHPDVAMDLFYKGSKADTKKKMFNDYGIDAGDLGPHFKDLITALDPYAHLIEVLSGPALSASVEEDFQYDAYENDYFFYLKQGFHLSPSVGQDNHYPTWGSITDARVGIVATTLTEAAIFEAIRLNRTFATEDKNLKVILYVNDNLMGSSIQAEEESELKIQVLIEDTDEPNSEYEISIYGAETEAELSTEATNWKAKDGLLETITVSKNGTYTVSGIFAGKNPSFYYARVMQNSTDDAWTAPVWVNEKQATAAGPLFYWTSNSSSKVYHIAGCSSVARIKPENLQTGTIPPANRTRHQCVVETDEDH
ncbi:MAG: hypothetical protein ABIR30_01455 [Chitinophagaceae bacterium]